MGDHLEIDNRRADARLRSFLGGRVIYGNGTMSIDVLVRDISEGGARLRLDGAGAVPDRFDLLVPCKGRTYAAELAWRNAGEIGVRFVTEQRPVDAEPKDQRLRKLEALNRDLQVRLQRLSGE